MEATVLLVPGVVLSLAYLLEPLVSKNITAPWDRLETLGKDDTSSESAPSTEQRPTDATESGTQPPAADTGHRRAMTDGGRVCHNCGSYVEGDYLYCAECLMPRV